jgi:hypothetical protein
MQEFMDDLHPVACHFGKRRRPADRKYSAHERDLLADPARSDRSPLWLSARFASASPSLSLTSAGRVRPTDPLFWCSGPLPCWSGAGAGDRWQREPVPCDRCFSCPCLHRAAPSQVSHGSTLSCTCPPGRPAVLVVSGAAAFCLAPLPLLRCPPLQAPGGFPPCRPGSSS